MKIFIVTIFVLSLIFSACDKPEKQKSNEGIAISNTWIRPGALNRNSAAFMKITNNRNTEDTLFSAGSDLAKVVEIHETFTKENDMKGMRHIEYLVIPSESDVELKPGSYHIMLIGLNKDMKKGEKGNIQLGFKNAGNINFQVEVQ